MAFLFTNLLSSYSQNCGNPPSESWLQPHYDLYNANDPDGEDINVPNPQLFINMIGVTGGKEINQYPFPANGFIKTIRSFHLMEHDFTRDTSTAEERKNGQKYALIPRDQNVIKI